MRLLIGILACFLIQIGFAQDQQLLQLSGVIIESGTNRPIPYATVYETSSYTGTAANSEGFFSLVAQPGDTIRFQAVGFATKDFILPDSTEGFRLSAIIEMMIDVQELSEITIQPWPSKEEFAQAFMELTLEPTQQIVNYEYLGFKKLDRIQIPEPNLFANPISFIYDNVISELKKRQKKPWKVKELPKFD